MQYAQGAAQYGQNVYSGNTLQNTFGTNALGQSASLANYAGGNSPYASLGVPSISALSPALLAPSQPSSQTNVAQSPNRTLSSSSNQVSPYSSSFKGDINNLASSIQSVINGAANTAYNPGNPLSVAYYQNTLGNLALTLENLAGGKYNNVGNDIQNYANLEATMQNLVNQGAVPKYFPDVANLLIGAPLIATGAGVEPLALAYGTAGYTALGALLTKSGRTPVGALGNAITGATVSGALAPITAELTAATPALSSGFSDSLSKLGFDVSKYLSENPDILAQIGGRIVNSVPQVATSAFNVANFFAGATALNYLNNGVVPTEQALLQAYISGLIIGGALPIGEAVAQGVEVGQLNYGIPQSTASSTRLLYSLGVPGLVSTGVGAATGSQQSPLVNFAIGAGMPLAEEGIESATGLGTAVINKAINPEGTKITLQNPSGSPTLSKAQFNTPEGEYNLELYPSTGAKPKYLPASKLEQQTTEAGQENPKLAQGIHTTQNKPFYQESQGTTYVGAPAEQGKGFRQIATVDKFGNPLYGSTPKVDENGQVINRAYLGYGTGENNAESSGKEAVANPNKAYGLRFNIADAVRTDDYAQISNTQNELADIRAGIANGDPDVARAKQYYQQYENYARSQGVPLASPVTAFYPSSEQEIVIAPGTVTEGVPNSNLNSFVIRPNQGILKGVPIAENILPSTLQYYTHAITPLPTFLSQEQLESINKNGEAQTFGNQAERNIAEQVPSIAQSVPNSVSSALPSIPTNVSQPTSFNQNLSTVPSITSVPLSLPSSVAPPISVPENIYSSPSEIPPIPSSNNTSIVPSIIPSIPESTETIPYSTPSITPSSFVSTLPSTSSIPSSTPSITTSPSPYPYPYEYPPRRILPNLTPQQLTHIKELEQQKARNQIPQEYGIYRGDIESGFGIEAPNLPKSSLLGIAQRPTAITTQEAARLRAQGIETPQQYQARKALTLA